jgi:hypothetical protein
MTITGCVRLPSAKPLLGASVKMNTKGYRSGGTSGKQGMDERQGNRTSRR